MVMASIINHTVFYMHLQATITFFNNTAGQDGGAIYATSLIICTRRRPELKDNEVVVFDYYNDSIFRSDPPFQFRFEII